MPTVLDPKPRPRRFFRRHQAPTSVVIARPTEPLGYEVESKMLDDLFAAGRIGRPGYELARRQLQRTYRVALPDAFGRES